MEAITEREDAKISSSDSAFKNWYICAYFSVLSKIQKQMFMAYNAMKFYWGHFNKHKNFIFMYRAWFGIFLSQNFTNIR
jgi:hypothetical protein